MKNLLSIYNLSYPGQYYWTHPGRMIREIQLIHKDGRDRKKKGYCRTDWLSMTDWFGAIFPAMLREAADKSQTYPGKEPFDTPEKWKDWLRKMADQIEQSTDYWAREHEENGFYEEYQKVMEEVRKRESEVGSEASLKPIEKIAIRRYYRKQKELYEARQALFRETMEEVLKYWQYLNE